MAKRKIIEIDRDKCDGCGLCTTACAEGALVLDEDNKAVLAREIYCDGLGACLDVCPTGALKIVERDSEAYDARAAYTHVLKTRGTEAAQRVHGAIQEHDHEQGSGGHQERRSEAPLACGCPGSMAREIKRTTTGKGTDAGRSVSAASELSQWPIQLHLVSPQAPYFNHSDLLVAADCTAFAAGGFHQDFLRGKKLVIACPKLDDSENYVEKLAQLLRHNTISSLTVAIMTVPCCSGLARMVEEAVALSGKDLPVKKIVIGLDGKALQSREIAASGAL
jgi:ferredoxin